MRIFRQLFLSALLLCAAAPGWPAAISARAAAQAPLVRLGSLLGPALSRLPELAPPALSPASLLPAPAALQPALAEALLLRAEAPAAESAAELPAASARRTLETVNSVLKDFSPEDLKAMPAEKLQALASVVMDRLDGGAAGADDPAGIAVLAQARARKIMALRGKVTETLYNPGHPENHGDLIDVRGAPERVKPVDARRVYRHYTTPEGQAAILASGSLWNGFLPYVELAPGVFRKTFADITGVFLTVPKVAGDSVGVPAKDFKAWVDVEVPEGLPVLEVERGAIYLIPLPGRTRDWVVKLYRDWADGKPLPAHEQETARKVAAEGPGPELRVPVRILGHGSVR